MKRITFILLAILLLTMPNWATISPASAAATGQESNCLFFTETVKGEWGFSVCDDQEANFRAAFERWGLQKIGYPISQRYVHDGFVTQAFQKAIMQWRPDGNYVALVNIFDDLHNAGFDDTLLSVRQTPRQFPAGWDGDIPFDEVVKKRQALLDVRPALRETYFASSDPLTFYGLPTSEVEDMGNHYAVRLQRAVLQEWKEEVPWAKEGEVTIANGGDIAKELGGLPAEALIPIPPPESGGEGGEGGAPPSAGTFFNHLNIVDIAWANDHKLAVGAADGIWLYDTNALDSDPLLLTGSEGLLPDYRGVRELTISHNGEWLALALEDNKIRLWSLTSNDPPKVLADHTEYVRAFAFSRDDTMLATAGGSVSGIGPYEFEDTQIRLWDLVSGDVKRLPMPKHGIVSTLAFAPALEGSTDGTILMAGLQTGFAGRDRSCDGSIRRWHVESGEEISADDAASAITFSADGRFAVSRTCYEGTIQLWDMSTGSEVYRRSAGGWPSGTRFSLNGTRFAVMGSAYGARAYQMRVWDQATGAELATLPATWPTDLSPDGRLLASGSSFTEHKIALWDIEQKKRLAVLAEHYEPVSKIGFSPDGAWLASASKNTVQLSPVPEAPASAPPPSLATTEFQLPPIQAMVWANEHTLAVAGADSMWLYDPNTPDGPQPLPGELSVVTSLAVSPSSAESSLLAAGLGAENSGQILLWSLASDEPPNLLTDHTHPVRHLAFSPDGTRLASGGGHTDFPTIPPEPNAYEDTDVRLWDVVSRDVTRLPNNGGEVTALAFSSDGALVMVGTDDALSGPDERCDGTLRQVDLTSGTQISTHRVATPIAFSPDGLSAVTGTCDNAPIMQLWNLATGSAVNIASPSNMDPWDHWAHHLTFSHNGASLAARVEPFGFGRDDNAGTYSTLVWNVATGAELAMLPSYRTIALSPNGRLAAVAHASEKHEVWLWDVEQNQLLASYEHDSPLIQIAFSPDGAWLASASEDRTLKLANVQSFSEK